MLGYILMHEHVEEVVQVSTLSEMNDMAHSCAPRYSMYCPKGKLLMTATGSLLFNAH